MLKRFLEMFFPGFSWEHGFALWDVGTAIGVGASVIGGMMGDDSAEDAADAQVAATQAAIEELKKIDQRTRGDTEPYRRFGTASIDRLSYLLGLTPQSGEALYDSKYGQLVDMSTGVPMPVASLYATDPLYRKAWDEALAGHRTKFAHTRSGGEYDERSDAADIDASLRRMLPSREGYSDLDTTDGKYGLLLRNFGMNDLLGDAVYQTGLQFGLDEGNKALERRASAMGSYDSGATLKALTRFANDYGTTKAEGAYSRFMNDKAFTLNALSGGVTTGQNAVNTDAQTGANIAQAVAGAQMGAGNARASGIVGGANAWGNALGNVGNIYNQYQTNQTLKTIFNPNA
jgi:hypothetical protein